MEIRLSRAEYWLLNAVVEAGYPLSFLYGPDVEVCFNKTGHGLSRERLVATLAELFERGWITAHRHVARSEDVQELGPLSIPSIDSALDEFPPLKKLPTTYYQMTPLGASIWEEFAAPDWNRYLYLCLPFSGSGEYIGATERHLRAYLDLVHHLNIKVDPATVVWDVIQPFEATYWKTLPQGYRASFEFVRTNSPAKWDEVPHEVLSLRRWYDWAQRKYHQDQGPWDLAQLRRHFVTGGGKDKLFDSIVSELLQELRDEEADLATGRYFAGNGLNTYLVSGRKPRTR